MSEPITASLRLFITSSIDELAHLQVGVRELLAEFACRVSHGECVTIRSDLLDEYVEKIKGAG